MNLENTTVTPDARKGLLVLRKSEDGLMHLIWKDRAAGTVVDDLIVFEGDATMRRLDECPDGFAMLLELQLGEPGAEGIDTVRRGCYRGRLLVRHMEKARFPGKTQFSPNNERSE